MIPYGPEGLQSLITETPQEGRELAIQIARKTIAAIQPDSGVRGVLRPAYANDPVSLMQAAQVVALEFRTIAEANGHWRQ